MSKARNLSDFISDATIDSTEIADLSVTHAKLHTDMNLSSKTLTFAANQISGNSVDGGVISNFASTGIDDNASATAVTILSDGNVGIGNDSPSAPLHIKKSISSTYTGGNTGILNSLFNITNTFSTSTVNAQANIQLGVYDGTHNRVTGIAAVAESATNRKASLVFWTDDENTRSEKLRITGDGNVGIGTDNPDRTLHIHSPDVGPLKIHSTNTNGSYIRLSDPNTTASPNHVWIGAQGNDTKFFQSNSLLSMIIKSDGDVGIGYDSPASKLDVRGELGANGTAATPTAYFVNRQSGATSGSIYIGASTGIDWKIGKNVTGIANNQNFSIADSSNNRRLDIDATGRVGINNTSPQGVLSIHGGTGTSYSEVESLNGVNFYKFFKVIDTARSLQMENIFIMPALSNGQKYIHFVTTKDGAMGFDLDILCGRSGSERMFGRVSLRGYKYHESDGDYRHGAIESTSSINAYGNYFEINGPVTQYLADSANATQESYSNPGNYWITRIPCYFNGGGSGQVEFTAFLKTMHHNTSPGGTYYMGIV